MSEARHALMSAVHAALMADGGLAGILAGGRVYDRVPRGADHPFVAFGEVASAPLDGDAGGPVEHRLEILVHSRAEGRREASDVANRVREVLDGAALTLSGHRLAGLRHRDTVVSASRDGRAYRARLRFRALTETI